MFSTSRYKNRIALSAWLCVAADTARWPSLTETPLRHGRPCLAGGACRRVGSHSSGRKGAPNTSKPFPSSSYSACTEPARAPDRASGQTVVEAHRVSWKIYTCLFIQNIDRKPSRQAGCAVFPKKIYRQLPDVSTGFCRLHSLGVIDRICREHLHRRIWFIR
jgi:hypothetical protein